MVKNETSVIFHIYFRLKNCQIQHFSFLFFLGYLMNFISPILPEGPCDSDDQCPPQLFCVEGDCWTLEPEKASQRQQRDPSVAHSHVEALVRAGEKNLDVMRGNEQNRGCFNTWAHSFGHISSRK